MEGKLPSAKSEVLGGEKGRFSAVAGEHQQQQQPGHCALQLTGLSEELAAVCMLPTSSIQT